MPLGEVTANASIPEDEFTADTRINDITRKRLLENKQMGPIIKACSQKGSSSWLMETERIINKQQYTLAVMPRLGIAHPHLPEELTCPGCKTLLNAKTALTHIPGCVKCKGQNATTKHNALVRFLYDLCLRAGIPCEREPRQFTSYTCSSCSTNVSPDGKKEHVRSCQGATFYRSGPDLCIHWATGEVFYDLTVIHELSPANLNSSCQSLLRDVFNRKQSKYVKSGLIPADQFACVPVFSSGSLHLNTRTLLGTLADPQGHLVYYG